MNNRRPTWRCRGNWVSSNAVDGGAETLGAAQQPARSGIDMEDVLREHRNERRRAGEQHGEQVEGDGAEKDPIAKDQDQARQDRHKVALVSLRP